MASAHPTHSTLPKVQYCQHSAQNPTSTPTVQRNAKDQVLPLVLGPTVNPFPSLLSRPPCPRPSLPVFLLKTAARVPSCAAFNKVCAASWRRESKSCSAGLGGWRGCLDSWGLCKQRHVPTLAQKHKAGGFPIGTNTADQLISTCIVAFPYWLSVISMPFFEYISTSRRKKKKNWKSTGKHEISSASFHPFILSSFHPFLFSNPLLIRLLQDRFQRSIFSRLQEGLGCFSA